jgi:hypothetical protein
MAKIIDLRGTGGQMILIGSAFALPTSNTTVFTANTPIVAGSMRYNPDANRIEFIGKDAESWNGISSDGGTYAPISHTHPSTDIVNFVEVVQDLLSTTLVAGDGIDIAYNDPTGALTLTITATPSLGTISVETGTSYAFVLGDDYVEFSNAGAITATVPANATVAFPIGTVLTIEQSGAGAVTLVPATDVTINVAPTHTLVTNGQYAVIQIKKKSANTWIAFGNLVTA